MFWRAQYNALMVFVFIVYIAASIYFKDEDVAIKGMVYQFIVHLIAITINFVCKIFGKPLFYDLKILEKGIE